MTPQARSVHFRWLGICVAGVVENFMEEAFDPVNVFECKRAELFDEDRILLPLGRQLTNV